MTNSEKGSQPMMDGELLAALCPSEEEQEEVKKWNEENVGAISCMFEERLEKADELREAGNKFLKEQDYDSALRQYLAAVVQLDFSVAQYGENAKPHEDQISSRKLKVLSNMSVMHLKANRLSETKSVADIGLRVASVANLDAETTNATEAKFWYLKGQANVERGFSEDAVEALKKAQALAPNDQQVRKVLAQALAARKEDTAISKEVWRNKLRTEDEVLAEGTWWHLSTILAKCREQRRRVQQRCCGRRQPHKGDSDAKETADAPPLSNRSGPGYRARQNGVYNDDTVAGVRRRKGPRDF
mmetsp:Transcript_4327/g.8626  ORF Transcript_4327/g.8626 Transcript_4327/m.8626 type:complete len:301 (+) Transcript_4327:59-961(+)